MRRPFTLLLLSAIALSGAAFASFSTRALAAPEPSVIPTSWQLSFKHGTIERLVLTVDGKAQTFYYMRYSVSNNTGKDILFTPGFELMTDTGQVVPAFKDVPKDVFKKIKSLYSTSMLQSPTAILGELLQGDDNAKEGVIIFTGIEADAREYQIFISGLSGETAEVKNPVTGKPSVLQKALLLDYMMPGQAIGIEPDPQLKATKWVMK